MTSINQTAEPTPESEIPLEPEISRALADMKTKYQFQYQATPEGQKRLSSIWENLIKEIDREISENPTPESKKIREELITKKKNIDELLDMTVRLNNHKKEDEEYLKNEKENPKTGDEVIKNAMGDGK